ncbi:GFA family protein [Maritimibacter sp. HL-12]|uniref:GFA family protein n=1 Tax=Maritimibacter sp. HL-12 TaxID=1162418 RepID=UPI000A0F161C|nr:GFA family protein [Maritimibacter sp. HL-12]SMH55789.1 Uncharacterized conserved protein [Maritimibacter sp. HL-12]
MTDQQGGCLGGALRFATTGNPDWVTVCHCRFCQRATGGAYMVEPIFKKSVFRIIKGTPKVFSQVSQGSGKIVQVHFCPECGTKLHLSFERYPDVVGVYAGTFDDPDWFEIEPGKTQHIFLGVARPDTIIPPGFPTFVEHATTNTGDRCAPTTYDTPYMIANR